MARDLLHLLGDAQHWGLAVHAGAGRMRWTVQASETDGYFETTGYMSSS